MGGMGNQHLLGNASPLRQRLALFATIALCAFSLSSVTGGGNGARRSNTANIAELSAGGPYRLPPLVQPLFTAKSTEAAAVAEILKHPPQGSLDGRLGIHLLRVYRDARIPRTDTPSAAAMLALFTGHPMP